MAITLAWPCEFANAQLVFEDDDRVAYAYLLIDKKIVSEVWLYNVVEAPSLPESPDYNRMPYTNPDIYISTTVFPRVSDPDELSVRWQREGHKGIAVQVFIRSTLHAFLKPGAKPGWCRLSLKKSPIARPLSELK